MRTATATAGRARAHLPTRPGSGYIGSMHPSGDLLSLRPCGLGALALGLLLRLAR